MGELKWKTPTPLIGQIETEREFLLRLSRWLRDQERPAEYDVEDNIALGGLHVAPSMIGFEGEHSGYSPPDEVILLTGPTAPSKFIVVSLHIGTTEGAVSAEIYVRKASTDGIIAVLNPATSEEKDVIGGGGSAGAVVLDAADEKIVLKTLAGATGIYGWAGSYVLVE